MKIDAKTKRKYFENNIPIGALSCIQTRDGIKYRIFPENGTDACWYDDRFLGDRYAVFIRHHGFYQQISKWYCYYGNAVNYMCKISEKGGA